VVEDCRQPRLCNVSVGQLEGPALRNSCGSSRASYWNRPKIAETLGISRGYVAKVESTRVGVVLQHVSNRRVLNVAWVWHPTTSRHGLAFTINRVHRCRVQELRSRKKRIRPLMSTQALHLFGRGALRRYEGA